MKAALSYFLDELGLSHRQLAVLLGTAHSTIVRYRSGLRSLPAEAEARLALMYAMARQAAQGQENAHGKNTDAGPVMPRDWRLEMQQTRQLRHQLRRQLKQVDHQLKQAAKMAQWLRQMEAHADMLPLPRQQRCLEELKHQAQHRQKSLQPQLEELNTLLWQVEQDISFLRHQLQMPFRQTGEE